MTRDNSIQKLCIAALLIAVGVVIPMFMPIKIILEPASFTLASHVPVFLAMMISPAVVCAVAIGTTIGFFLGGFPIVVVLRAASHLVFALAGSIYLQRHPATMNSPVKIHIYSFLVGLTHAAGELLVVSAFYFGGGMGDAYYQQGFLRSVLLLVGVGSVIHSMVDFEIALIVAKALGKQKSVPILGTAK